MLSPIGLACMLAVLVFTAGCFGYVNLQDRWRNKLEALEDKHDLILKGRDRQIADLEKYNLELREAADTLLKQVLDDTRSLGEQVEAAERAADAPKRLTRKEIIRKAEEAKSKKRS